MDTHPEDRASERSQPRRPVWRPRLATLLLLVALVPVLGMAGMAIGTVQQLREERAAADRIEAEVDELEALLAARLAVGDEEIASSVLVHSTSYGATASQVEAFLGFDVTGQLADARARVDADPVLAGRPRLARATQALVALRPAVDAGEASPIDLLAVSSRLRAELDGVWRETVRGLTGQLLETGLPGAIQVRFAGLASAYDLLAVATDQAVLTELLLTGGTTLEHRRQLVAAAGTYEAIANVLATRLGRSGQAAWSRFLADVAAQRFDRALALYVQSIVDGEPVTLGEDPRVLAAAFIDIPIWMARITDVVREAAADLSARAADHAADADGAVRTQVVLVLALGSASLAIAALVARSINRPTRRLAGAASEIREGRFAHAPLAVRGPRELADTAQAFNEMSATLAGVERHATSLADDLDDPDLRSPLPGPTGRALQVALNRLRASMQLAESRRLELQQAATHDALTGLLNRGAALDALGRDLLRANRGAGPLVVLFIDLDGLKRLNDDHGHGAGDDALRATADAIRQVTRGSDVVGRLGGDELLVASLLEGDADLPQAAEDLAERVRAEVASRSVTVAEDRPPIPLRCSVGLAVAMPADTAQSLVDRADHALLEAKRAGKDRVVWAADDESALAQRSTGAPGQPSP